jgi:hypothetical protein
MANSIVAIVKERALPIKTGISGAREAVIALVVLDAFRATV